MNSPKATERQELIELLEAKYPKMQAREDGEHGIRISGEDGIEAEDEMPLFNYYSQDYKEVKYVLGVHKEMRDFLDSHGWFPEWENAGVI